MISLVSGYLMARPLTVSDTGAPAQAWQDMVIESEPGFHASMPGIPRHTINTVTVPSWGLSTQTASFVSEDMEGRSYVINVTAIPQAFQQRPQEALFRAMIDLLITSESDIPVSFAMRDKSAEFKIVREGGGSFVEGRMSERNGIIILQMISYTGNLPEANYQHFIQSFTF